VDRRIAQGLSGTDRRADEPPAVDERRSDTSVTVVVGLAIVAVMLLVYVASDLERPNLYNHFVWQASAWLDGQASIPYPVFGTNGAPDNDYFNDVQQLFDASGNPTGRALLPFPPLPAVILLPFVALFGLATNEQLLAAFLGALDVGLAFWMLGLLRVGTTVRTAVTVFFGLGTVFWFTAEKGTTWYFAHVVAVGFTFVAIGLALGGDHAAISDALDGPESDDDPDTQDVDEDAEDGEAVGSSDGWRRGRWHALRTLLDGRQFLVGILFGLACTARLTVVFGALFFVVVGSGGTWWRRGVSAALGAAIPLAALAVYNLVSTGHVFSPVYDYLYQAEASGYTFLGYHSSWAIEDPRYLPQNLVLALIGPPDVLPRTLDFGVQLCTDPGATPGWFDPNCPILSPKTVGMGLLYTSPAYLLGLPALALYGRSRLVTGAALGIFFIFVVNLMHFSQGWVQFGYRFSLDFAPFALLLVALGLRRLSDRRPGRALIVGGALIAISIAVNLWGVYWASVFGW
jgi:hypothetical protein